MATAPTFKHLVYALADNGVLVVRVTANRFELEQAQSLSALLFESPTGKHDQVLLNLAGVEYITSTGVSLLVRLGTERNLRVANVHPAVAKVMGAIGLLPLLKIHRSEREAMEAF